MASVDALDPGAGLAPEAVETVGFATVRRGYEPESVRTRLREAAEEIRRLNSLVASLSERIAEFEATPPARLESTRVAEALGDEATRVLQAAQDAAQERVDRAEAESDEIIGKARTAAAAIVEQGRDEGKEMVVEARNVRARILADLASKRQTHRAEVEQLRAIRDRLLEAIAICRQGLDDWVAELVQAGPQAAAAAERAGLRIAAEPEPTVGQIEAEIRAAHLAGLPLDSRSEGTEPDDAASAEGDDVGPGEAPEPGAVSADADYASGTELGDLDSLEDLDELDESNAYVEIVGYDDSSTGSTAAAAVGLYDVEAESDSDHDTAPGPQEAQPPELEDVLAVAVEETSEPESDPAITTASHADVIFARLRSIASRPAAEPSAGSEAPEPAHASAGEPSVGEPSAGEPLVGEPSAGEPLVGEPSAGEPLVGEPSAGEPLVGEPSVEESSAGEPSVEESSAGEPSVEAADGEAPDVETETADAETPDPDDLMSAARAVAVGGIARRLKRLVVDEQGELLDSIRRSGSRALRGAIGADTEAYRRAAREPLQDFASDIDVSIDDVDLKAAGVAIVSVLVEPVHARLSDLMEETDDADELSSAVRSVYRESRSRRAEAAAEAAFSAAWPEPVS